MSHQQSVKMEGVREYDHRLAVSLSMMEGRWIIEAVNEGGFAGTYVDALDLLGWIKKNRPDLWEAA